MAEILVDKMVEKMVEKMASLLVFQMVDLMDKQSVVAKELSMALLSAWRVEMSVEKMERMMG